MFFTVANLLTLGIVVVVLVVFRQFDKNNRSLEKVKKLGDRLQGDLDSYVTRRAEELKQYGIELDVQQKAAKEVLRRIQSVEEGLNERAESMIEVEKRLSEYDSVLARLIDMTARAEGNLGRIRDEGAFTETVAKRIEGASKAMVAIERELPALREDFARDSLAALETIRDGLAADTMTKVAAIRENLDRARAEAELALSNAVAARRDADKEYSKAFERARDEAEKLEDMAFDKLRTASEAKAARLRETVEEKFTQIGQFAKDRVAETQVMAKAFKNEWQAEADALLAATRTAIGDGSTALDARLAESEQRLADSVKLIDGKLVLVEGRASEAEGRVAALAEHAEARFAELAASLQADLEAASRSAGERVGRIEEGLVEIESSVVTSRQEFARRLAQAEAETSGMISEKTRQAEDSLHAAIAALQQKLEDADQGSLASLAATEARQAETIAGFETRWDSAGARIAAVEKDIETRMADLAGKAESSAQDFGGRLLEMLGAQRADFKRQSADLAGMQSTALAELRSTLEAALAAKEGGILELRAALELAKADMAEADHGFSALIAASKAEAAALLEKLSHQGQTSTLEVLAAVEKRLDEYGAEVESKFQRLEAVNADIGFLEGALRQTMSDMSARVEGEFAAWGRNFEEKREMVALGFERDSTRAATAIQNLESELASLKERSSENVSANLKIFEDEFLADLRARKDRTEESLSAWKADRDRAIMELAARVEGDLGKSAKDLSETIRAATEDTRGKVFERLEAVRTRVESIGTDIATEAGAARARIEDLGQTATAALAEARQGLEGKVSEEIASLDEGLQARLAGLAADTEGKLEDAAGKVARIASEQEARALAAAEETRIRLAAVEAAIEAFDRDIEARLSSSDTSNRQKLSEIDAVSKEAGEAVQKLRSELDSTLDEAKTGFGTRLESEVGRLAQEASDRIAAAAEESGRRVTEILAESRTTTESLQELRASLAEELARARIDFSTRVQAELAQLAAETDTHLAAVGDETGKRLSALDAGGEAARQGLQALRDALSGELEEARQAFDARLDGDLARLGTEASGRIAAASEETGKRLSVLEAEALASTEGIASLREGFVRDLAETRQVFDARLGTEIARMSEDASARVAVASEDAQRRLSSMTAALAGEEANLRSMKEEIARTLEAFKGGFQKDIGETGERLRSDFEAWRGDLEGLIVTLRTDYEGQRDQWISRSEEERDRIGRELTSLSERGAGLRENLETRVREALTGFSNNYDELVSDQSKRSRELLSGIDERSAAFREAAQNLGLGLDAARAAALGRIDAEAQRLTQVLSGIDREQKAFVAQTRVFERSDELAARLAESIAAMKGELAGLETRRQALGDFENQLKAVKKQEEETNQRIAKFLSEKKRVDALEDGFARIETVAGAVDRRMTELTSQGDALTEAQSRIRKLLELSTEAESKYERLEKKGEVIDATVEAVEKNFRTVGEIERTVATLAADLKRLPERVAEVDRSVQTLSAGKDRLDAAAKKLAELDTILAETDRRLEEARKVREWLARAETRLEEINRQAEEQLKLLSTLLKEEGSDKRGKGAPPGTVQETVRKLARQGWATEEIARAVKISRGEVELILELGGKN